MPSAIEKLPEFDGLRQYLEAAQDLLDNAHHVGAVVIRGCFNPAVPAKETSTTRGIVRLVSDWLPGQGLKNHVAAAPTYPVPSRNSGMISAYNHQPRPTIALTEFRSLRGIQDLYITPSASIVSRETGAVDEELVENSRQKRKSLDQIISRTPSDANRRALFSYIARLRAGDAALVIGEPVLPYVSLKSYKNSEYVQYIYPLADAAIPADR